MEYLIDQLKDQKKYPRINNQMFISKDLLSNLNKPQITHKKTTSFS
jgi:hypothetical protein